MASLKINSSYASEYANKITGNIITKIGGVTFMVVKSKFRTGSCTALALVMALGAVVNSDRALAQESGAAVEDSANQVGDIVVTAQRREQRLGDVPISVQAQTGAQLIQAGVNG